MTDLKFEWKLSRSADNKASVITIPRPIALAWEQYNSFDLIFDGDTLVIKPNDKNKVLGDEVD